MAENPSDLVGKEFIFEYGVYRILPPSDKTGGVFATEQRAYRRERIVRCLDCTRCERVGDMAYCHHFRLYVPPRGFCWAGEPR